MWRGRPGAHIDSHNVVLVGLSQLLHDLHLSVGTRFRAALHRDGPLGVVNGQILQTSPRADRREMLLHVFFSGQNKEMRGGPPHPGAARLPPPCHGLQGAAPGEQQDLRRDGDLCPRVLLDLLEVAALFANQPPHQTVVSEDFQGDLFCSKTGEERKTSRPIRPVSPSPARGSSAAVGETEEPSIS